MTPNAMRGVVRAACYFHDRRLSFRAESGYGCDGSKTSVFEDADAVMQFISARARTHSSGVSVRLLKQRLVTGPVYGHLMRPTPWGLSGCE
jgi:hypothetical protein